MSGRKNFLNPYRLIDSESMGASVTSDPFNVQGLDSIAVQFVFSGTPTGTFSVQVSGNYNTVTASGDWDDLFLNPSMTASGASGTASTNIQQLAFLWMRLKYTRTGGTGSLDAYVSGKMI